MKKIQVLILLMLSLQLMSVYAAQESKQNVDEARQTMINNVVKNLKYLSQGFDFLRSQNFVDITFHDFLEQQLSHDEYGNEDMNFDQVLIAAEAIITKNMKDTFLNTLDAALQNRKDLAQCNDPVFLYVMQHKNDDLYEIVRLWLYEWAKNKNQDGSTPLDIAVNGKHIEITSMLIDAGADVNIQNSFGQSPLHYTSFAPEIARILIDASADINIKDENKETLLHYAVRHNNIEITRMLIDEGADVNAQNIFGQTPLHQVIYLPKTALMLINAGNNIPLHHVDRSNVEIAWMLINAKGFNVNLKDENRETLLHYAVRHNNIEITRMLIDKGADVNIKDENKETLLHYAVRLNSLEITSMLIDAGVDVNNQNSFGQAPLHYTSSVPEIARMLIDKGADVNIKDENRETLLHYVVRSNNIEITRMLIDKGADVNAQNRYGETPLHQVIYLPKRTRILIDAGNNTPLHYADTSNVEIAWMLINAKGININIKDENGKTPLHYAVKVNDIEIVRMLIDAGADLNIQNKKEKTAEQEVNSRAMKMVFAQIRYARSAPCTIS